MSDCAPTKTVKVAVTRSIASLEILTIGASFKESYWLNICVTTSTSSSILFYGMVRLLQPSELVMMACKHVLHGVMLQLMLLQRFFDLSTSDEWLLRFSKPRIEGAFADCWKYTLQAIVLYYYIFIIYN